MAEVVNLNHARKAAARAAARRQADANAAKFGRSKAERNRETAEARQQAERLESHRRERPEGD